VVEGPADLEEAREEMGRLPTGGESAVGDREEALEVADEPLVGVDPPGGGALLLDEAIELLLVAVEEQVEDEVLVETELVRRRPGSRGQAPAQRLDQRLDPLAQPDQVGVLVQVGPCVPEGAGGDELRTQGRPLALDPLGEKGIGVDEGRDRLDER